ncbi:hypothetical protein ACXGQW_09960 [Wenyingzhuangia sp. IMCC45533]
MKFFKAFLKLSFVIVLLSQLSCRKDFSTEFSNGNLRFSVDTLFLDTVFNNLSTNTARFTVHNTSKNDVLIPSIKLERNDSKYRINVDGKPGVSFSDVLLRAKDSLFVSVETTPDTSDLVDMLYTDKIIFDPNGNTQEVQLVTLVKEANLLFSSTDNNFELDPSTTFTKDIPYVIFGNAIVPENGSLTIEAGATIHFNDNSGLTISPNATLNINGTLSDSIVFKSDALSFAFDEVPGQWNGIDIKENTNVNIDYLRILNPTTAIKIKDNTNTVTITNTEIYNAASYGVLSQNSNISASNLVIGNARVSGLKLQGGDYRFNHCTFGNFWLKSNRFEANVSLSNSYLDEDGNEVLAPLSSANFVNSIITGSSFVKDEVALDKNENEAVFNFNFKNCLIDLEKGEDLFDTDNTSLYTNVLFNKEYDFKDTSKNDLRIGMANEGINQADKSSATLIPLDILGTDRTATPDIGAYQHIDFTTLEETKDE